jgi:VWFA-related protein
MSFHNSIHDAGHLEGKFARGCILAFILIGASLFACGIADAQSTVGPITPPPPKVAPTQPAQTQATPKINVEAKLVYLYVNVRDKKGKNVPGLSAQDFTLEEDGRPENITHFMVQSNVPLTLGLLVDTSLSQRNVLNDERDASYKFLDQMLHEKDEAFVIHFDHEVELLQDLTASRPKLNAALQQLQTPQPQFSNGGDSGDGGTGNGNDGGGTTDPNQNGSSTSGRDQDHAHSGGGTLLYDAIYLAANDEMKKQQGRKAIFVLSDGEDRGSKETLVSAIEAAQRADTSVYSIYFADHESESNDSGFGHHGGWGGGRGGWPGGGGGWPGGGGHRYPQESRTNGKDVLKRISNETGGELIEVSKKLPIDQVFAQIEEELRNQYAIGYTPDHSNTGPGFHTIALKTKKKDLIVQVREGYYSDN